MRENIENITNNIANLATWGPILEPVADSDKIRQHSGHEELLIQQPFRQSFNLELADFNVDDRHDEVQDLVKRVR